MDPKHIKLIAIKKKQQNTHHMSGRERDGRIKINKPNTPAKYMEAKSNMHIHTNRINKKRTQNYAYSIDFKKKKN